MHEVVKIQPGFLPLVQLEVTEVYKCQWMSECSRTGQWKRRKHLKQFCLLLLSSIVHMAEFCQPKPTLYFCKGYKIEIQQIFLYFIAH